MPRKLLSDCDRGWYGWESHNSSVLRMSNCCLWDCRHKMDLEKFRHHEHMQRLQQLQKTEQLLSRKAFRSLQDEYSRIRAEQTVLRRHAFTTYDPTCEDPPPPPRYTPSPPPPSLSPRRPKTERIPCVSAVHKDLLLKRNSLPSLSTPVYASFKDTGTVAPHKSKKSVQVSASGCTSTPGKKAAVPGIVAPLKGLKKGKGRRRSRKLAADSEGSFFLTDAAIMNSTVIEEEEEEEDADEGEDEVFYDHQECQPIHNAVNDDTAVTSEVWGRGDGQIEGPGNREGIDPQQHSFQSIDYILGAKKEPVQGPGTLTSTHLAKPCTPKGAVRPSTHKDSATFSSNKKADTTSTQNPSRAPSHKRDKQSSVITVSEVKVTELPRSVPKHVQPHAEVSHVSHTRLSPNSTVGTDPALDKTAHSVLAASSRGNASRADHAQSTAIPQTSDSSSRGTYSNEPRSHPHEPRSHSHEPRSHSHELGTHSPETEPRTHSYKLGSHHHESRSHLHEPGTHAHKPGTHPHELRTHSHKPGTHLHEPETHSHKSGTYPHEPETHSHKSGTHPHEPETHSHKPGTYPHEPETHSHKPGTHSHKPGTDLHELKNRANTTTTSKVSSLQATDPVPAKSSSKLSSLLPRPASLLDEQSETDRASPGPPLLSRLMDPTDVQTKTDQTDPKSSLFRFRQAAEVIMEEVRYERETDTRLFTALLLNRPHRQVKMKQLEKPSGVALQEKEDMWKGLLTNVHNAVRWKAKALRESQGLLNTRQMRRRARQQQQEKERARRHVFPGQCKTSYAMKKFLNKQVDQLVEAWRPENRRKHRNDMLREKATLPEFVDRVRTTTAILRDFKQYQNSQAKEKVHV